MEQERNPNKNAELSMEQNGNMIDGIINNGSKEDIDKAKAELAEGIKSMESLAENPFVPQEMRENATAELEKMRKQLELLDSADEVQVDSWLSAMIENGDAVLTDDGGFKVNPDYYKELPRGDRHVETMTEVQAVEVMSALTAAGVAYSAATKGEDKVGITVSKQDVPVLNDVMYASIGKIAHTEAAKENGGKGEKGKYQTINPEYYASLGKEDKHTRVEPIDTARQIVAELIREKALHCLNEEIPHGIAVSIEKMKARKKVMDIEATIICERDSHKGIIIGKQGSMLKKIGSTARYEIEQMLECKVNLQLWVKVKKDWRDSDFLIKNFGYREDE